MNFQLGPKTINLEIIQPGQDMEPRLKIQTLGKMRGGMIRAVCAIGKKAMKVGHPGLHSRDLIGDVSEGENRLLKHSRADVMALAGCQDSHAVLSSSLHAPDVNELPLTLTRDFDSLVGITNDLPFQVSFSIYPVPRFRDTMSADNHFTRRITLVRANMLSVDSFL